MDKLTVNSLSINTKGGQWEINEELMSNTLK